MKTPHERSLGAQLERRALRAYLRRRARSIKRENPNDVQLFALGDTLDWLLARAKRYDKRKGGLGRR